MQELKQKILNKLKEKHKLSGGHCGILYHKLGPDIKLLKKVLNQMYVDDLITVHDNAHGKLIKLKINNKNK